MTTDFITFCHPGDIHRLYHGTWLENMIDSHEYPFDHIRIIHQRCKGYLPLLGVYWDSRGAIIKSDDHPHILTEFGLPENDDMADHYTHGPTAPHYWKWHVINHLIGLKVSSAKYIVFSDADCTIKSRDLGYNWIRKGIEVLERYPEVLIVSPGDGGTMLEAQTNEGYRLTQNVSQQLFLCEREKLAGIDFNVDWGGELGSNFRAPGGPMQEYYFMAEGRMWRYMDKHDLWRCIVPDYVARYWHWNILTDDGFFVADESLY